MYCTNFIIYNVIKKKKINIDLFWINKKTGLIFYYYKMWKFYCIDNYVWTLFNYFFCLNLYVWKYLNFAIIFHLENNDLRLLNRDVLLLVINLFNITKLNFYIKNKITSVLRSPFVYNKIQEQFKINCFKIKFKNLIQTNLLIDNYYFDLQFNKLHYSLLRLWKNLL